MAGCPCGGTHVENSREIGKVVIRKMDKKKKSMRIGYDVVSR